MHLVLTEYVKTNCFAFSAPVSPILSNTAKYSSIIFRGSNKIVGVLVGFGSGSEGFTIFGKGNMTSFLGNVKGKAGNMIVQKVPFSLVFVKDFAFF